MENSAALIEKALTQFLTRHTPAHQTPVRLRESIAYSLLGPGKRIRPRLALTTGALLGLSTDVAMAGALAVELIHCFTLIHDDLPCLDNDDVRRGRPSNHKQFDEATALLAGDALQSLAFEAILSAPIPNDSARILKATRRLAQVIGPRGVIGGQMAESALTEKSKFEDLIQMHRLKTGALFDASILIACDLAGHAENERSFQSLSNFATALGGAFQILDDLDDAQQDSTRTPVNTIYYRKPKDAAEFAQHHLREACARLQDCFQTRASELMAFANELSEQLQGFVQNV